MESSAENQRDQMDERGRCWGPVRTWSASFAVTLTAVTAFGSYGGEPTEAPLTDGGEPPSSDEVDDALGTLEGDGFHGVVLIDDSSPSGSSAP